ncbi:MAG TPA: hypothetical protein VK563_21925 [Puia sp.]|nr:hypothetical protein [Puia sp.]
MPDTTATRIALENTIQCYHNFMGEQALIYNGIEHIDYPVMTGHPYFDAGGVQKGSVVYDGILYDDMPMLYDLVRDQVVIFNFSGESISLSGEKIKEFSLPGHRFINSPSGFYELLCSGTVTLLAKRTKTVEESIVDLTVVYTAIEKDHYFIIKGGVNHPVANLNSMLEILKDKRKEIRQDLRRKKIKYRKEHDRAMVSAVQYYNQSSHQ